MLFIFLCLLLGQGALSYEHHIKNASDLINFSKNVNGGRSYSGTTVFLDADIDFSDDLSEQFESIGKTSSFKGTFNGQGHTISKLAMKSSSEYVGLFGNSWEGTIRNVVLDSSCSFVSSFSGSSSVYAGGITRSCSDCTIENTLNMASVSFTGNVTGNGGAFTFGGIVGYLSVSSNGATVKNCANYGSVTHSGTADYTRIGGIVGYSIGGSSPIKYIQNCLNYGTINNSGTSSSLWIGGILGSSNSGTYSIENCVSAGKITSNKTINYIGSVVGSIYFGSTVNITHCYWTSDVGNYKPCGSGSPTTYSETKQVTLNIATVDSLNSYNSSWNKWLLNTNNKIITFNINSGRGFNISSQLVLLPSLAESENHTFSGWFEDEECTKEFTGSSVETDTTLYGGWSYVLTFDFGNGTTSSKSVVYGQKYGTLPNANRTGHTFTGWFTEAFDGEKITADTTITLTNDHTLYARWTINNYTITFDYGNGTVVNENLKYNETIIYPKNITREGYTFSEWVPKPERMPAEDITVVAQWIIKQLHSFI